MRITIELDWEPGPEMVPGQAVSVTALDDDMEYEPSNGEVVSVATEPRVRLRLTPLAHGDYCECPDQKHLAECEREWQQVTVLVPVGDSWYCANGEDQGVTVEVLEPGAAEATTPLSEATRAMVARTDELMRRAIQQGRER